MSLFSVQIGSVAIEMGKIMMMTRQERGTTDIVRYAFGWSILGNFVAATDNVGLCALMFGDDQNQLLSDIQTAFVGKTIIPAVPYGDRDSLVKTILDIMERPGSAKDIATSTQGGDFERMVAAALRSTKPGTTITPETVAATIGASPESAQRVRNLAKSDILAIATPFHRLEEANGTNPSYRWGEVRRQAFLQREAAGLQFAV